MLPSMQPNEPSNNSFQTNGLEFLPPFSARRPTFRANLASKRSSAATNVELFDRVKRRDEALRRTASASAGSSGWAFGAEWSNNVSII